MPVGVFINVFSVALGGIAGSLAGDKLSQNFKEKMTLIFGLCALAMGITSVVLMRNMPVVVFSVIVGTLIGSALKLSDRIRGGAEYILTKAKLRMDIDNDLLLTSIVLFCASGTGIYGALTSGMTGDHGVLIAKSVLDFFTAMIFACSLRWSVSLISVPQLVSMLILFYSSKLIFPLTSDSMIADFKACGGVILLATGFSIMKIKDISIADMIPVMVIVMPISWLWTVCFY